jgi:hypothetical protein
VYALVLLPALRVAVAELSPCFLVVIVGDFGSLKAVPPNNDILNDVNINSSRDFAAPEIL